MPELDALRLVPEYHERVWGGHHLQPDSKKPVGEAWIVYEMNKVASGPHEGRTLDELARQYGAALLGPEVHGADAEGFPLLIKLLDCAQWLSLQVHPNDKQAVELEGPGHRGKTEAWYVIEAERDAQIISGIRAGTQPQQLAEAIVNGTLMEFAQYASVATGDTVLTRAGTVHALGPGLLIYEVQQTSDITYRIYDWDRPQQGGRALHTHQSAQVADPDLAGELNREEPVGSSGLRRVTECEYFVLDLVQSDRAVHLDTGGASFHAITVIEGEATVTGSGWSETLRRFETAIVPACCGAYRIEPDGPFSALKSSLV